MKIRYCFLKCLWLKLIKIKLRQKRVYDKHRQASERNLLPSRGGRLTQRKELLPSQQIGRKQPRRRCVPACKCQKRKDGIEKRRPRARSQTPAAVSIMKLIHGSWRSAHCVLPESYLHSNCLCGTLRQKKQRRNQTASEREANCRLYYGRRARS